MIEKCYLPFIQDTEAMALDDLTIMMPTYFTHQTEADQESREQFYKHANNTELIEMNITTSLSSECPLEVTSLQKVIYMQRDETSMVFCRCYNPSEERLNILSVAIISPVEAIPYVVKLQCFCFEEFTIGPYETVDLPIVFFLDSDCPSDIDSIYLDYLFMII